MGNDARPNLEPIEKALERLGVDAVFGEPVKKGDVTVIPVAEVSFSFGHGRGQRRWERGDGTRFLQGLHTDLSRGSVVRPGPGRHAHRPCRNSLRRLDGFLGREGYQSPIRFQLKSNTTKSTPASATSV